MRKTTTLGCHEAETCTNEWLQCDLSAQLPLNLMDFEESMALLRFLLPAVAAALLSACSGSPAGEFGGGKPQLTRISSESAGEAAKGSDEGKNGDAAARDQQAVISKVALTLSSASDPNSKAYKIGPRDVLEVTVFKVQDLSKVVQVSEAGTINYPLVGEVQAGGKTAREVEQDLTKLLGTKYLQNPQISVFVKEYNSQRVTVEGAVKKPGVYPIVGGMSLLQGLAVAGGFESSAEETVLLIRQKDGKSSAGRFDVSQIRQGKAEDVQLEAGDVVIAPTSDIKQGLEVFLRLAPLANIAPLL
jgi:polysaccharide export outer membrane protein